MRGQGQALVELALVMPLLVMLMVGVVELGRLMDAKQRLVYGTALALRVYAFGGQGLAEGAISVYFGENLCPASEELGTICDWSPPQPGLWEGSSQVTLKLGYTQAVNLPFWEGASFPLTAQATTVIYARKY